MIIYILLFSFVCNLLCMEDTPTKLTIITGDEYTDSIDKSLIDHCDLLKEHFEIYPHERSVPLPALSKDIWKTVKLCLGYSAILSNPHSSKVLRQKTELNFAQCISTQTKLFKLLMAANYLGHKHLSLMCKEVWANRDYSAFVVSPSHYSKKYKVGLPYELDLSIVLKKKETQQLIDDVGIWTAKKIEVNPLTILSPEQNSVWSNAFNNAGTCIAGGHYNGALSMYNTESKQLDIIPNAHEGKAISMVQFNNNDTQLLSSARNKTIKIWDLTSHECTHTLSHEDADCFAFSMNPQNTLIVSDALDNGILLWNIANHENPEELIVPKKLNAHTKSIFAFDFNSAGDLFASASEDQTVKLWNAAGNNPCIVTFDDYPSSVMSVQFGKSKKWLASGDWSGNIYIHDITTKKLLWKAQEHTEGIWSVPFAENDTLLCSGSIDNAVKLWDTRTQSCIKTVINHTLNIHFMSINHTHGILASASGDGTMALWDMRQLAQPIQKIRRYFERNSSLEKIDFIEQARKHSMQKPLNVILSRNEPVWNSFTMHAKKILKDNLPIATPPVLKRKGKKNKKIRLKKNSKNIEVSNLENK